MDNNVKQKIYVLYHASCMDGAGARYAAWKKFQDTAEYIAVNYGRPLPEMTDGSEVYILDFSYDKQTLLNLKERMSFVIVLDHHKTAKEDLENLDFAQFNMDKSGAVLAWEYFHPNSPIPKLIEHVQDRDLWKFSIPDTKAVIAGFRNFQNDIPSWDVACSETDEGNYFLDKVRANGKAVVEYTDSLIESAIKNVTVIDFLGYTVGIVNATNHISEIGEAIYSDKKLNVDFSITYFLTSQDGNPILSFRSKSLPVSWIAKELGGGGHDLACGAPVDLHFLSDLLNNKFADHIGSLTLLRLHLKKKYRKYRSYFLW